MSYMVEEIWQELAKAKYTEWERSSKEIASQLRKLEYVIYIGPTTSEICHFMICA